MHKENERVIYEHTVGNKTIRKEVTCWDRRSFVIKDADPNNSALIDVLKKLINEIKNSFNRYVFFNGERHSFFYSEPIATDEGIEFKVILSCISDLDEAAATAILNEIVMRVEGTIGIFSDKINDQESLAKAYSSALEHLSSLPT